MTDLTDDRIIAAATKVRRTLLDERTADGHWAGELSTSALSTATAVMALEQVSRATDRRRELQSLIDGGLGWLAAHQNEDGGWGDTTKSFSNISTTMLAHAVYHATDTVERFQSVVEKASSYIERAGGVQAVLDRYGKDKTFSIPILTHCALAGLVSWSDVLPLPFELACIPARFYKTVRLPVVSYALPALIAIGQVRHHFRKPWNPVIRMIRGLASNSSLRVLESIQPTNGGFLEATPLTSFVTMSLAAMGQADGLVARRGVQFIQDSVLDDGSWPIDTDLATWVTTLSVNALGEALPADARPRLREWLLGQQYRDVHPYTNADPGGWAWTDLPGGVPDADDTPGALLALLNLREGEEVRDEEYSALTAGVGWLLDLQNRDGGVPTFCRGWGALPFDRSGADLTAHTIRAWLAFRPHCCETSLGERIDRAVDRAFDYLKKTQRSDGSWLPLWFGNQHNPQDDENPVYGTARVLAAYRDAGKLASEPAQAGVSFLEGVQNTDGGWGGGANIVSSVEESALATEIMLSIDGNGASAKAGLNYVVERVEADSYTEATPIGFYFAKLWYFERLYPLTFLAGALHCALLDGKRSGTQSNMEQQTVSG